MALGIDTREIRQYNTVHIPSDLDCSAFRNGTFETEELIIKRNGSKQFETDKKTGEKHEYDVAWLSTCEYTLTAITGSPEQLHVKIIRVAPEKYGCFVLSDKDKHGFAHFVSLTRVK